MMKRHFIAALAIVACLVGSRAFGQVVSDYTISVEDGVQLVAEPGDLLTIDVLLDNQSSVGVFGWAIAVQHDPSKLQLETIAQGNIGAALPMGFPPAFEEVTVISNSSGDGYINATVLSLSESFFFAGNSIEVLSTGTYTNLMTVDGDTTDIAVVDLVLANLPSPPVEIGVSVLGGVVLEVDEVNLVDLTVENEVPPSWSYEASDVVVNALLGVDAFEAQVDFTIEQIAPYFENPDQDFDSFSMAVTHDPAELQVDSVDAVTGVTSPAEVAYFGATLLADGFVLGVVSELDPANPFPLLNAMAPIVVATANYVPPAGTTPVDGDVFESAIAFTDGLASVPGGIEVNNEIALVSSSGDPMVGIVSTVDGSVEIRVLQVRDFIRGDCNDDGLLNIADAIVILQSVVALLGSGSNQDLDCIGACDVDGMTPAGGSQPISLNDAVLLLAFTLGLDPANLSVQAPGAAVLPAPGSSCGQFPGQAPADCVLYTSCP